MPENPEVKPITDNIPIVKLTAGQRIKLEAYARLGRGNVHAKWQSVSAATYSYDEKARTFTFLVESSGTMPAENIVPGAARMINAKSVGVGDGVGWMTESCINRLDGA